MKCSCLLSIFLAAFGLATHAAAAERYALVIGVNECPGFRLADGSQPRALRGAETDAQAVAETLRKEFGFPPNNVKLLVGSDANYAAVKAAFDCVRRRAKRGDSVVVYFAGHGTQIPDRAPSDETTDDLDEALCLADANQLGENLLVDDELGLWLDEFDAGEVTVILDCCHAGTGTKEAEDDAVARYLPFPGVNQVPAEKSVWSECRSSTKNLFCRRTAFFACQPRQQAYERRFPALDPPARAGQFTHFFLQAFSEGNADKNHDGVISSAEALAYVRLQLDKSFNGVRDADARQEPTLESDNEDVPALAEPLKKTLGR